MTPYRIRRHRKRRHGGSHFALVPFIDMMTILVVFLLAHTAETEILPNTKNISIPQSNAEVKPHPSVVVMVTRDTLYVDGQPVGPIAELIAAPGPVIEPLKKALLAQNDTILGEAQKSDISIQQQGGALVNMAAGTKLADLVKALNALGATPMDLLAILQAMKTAGALHAEIEVI